jgi:hypothetical protein
MVGKIFIMIENAFGCILYSASFGGLYISPQISVRKKACTKCEGGRL